MHLSNVKGKKIYFVGIKGAGMSALALILKKREAEVLGTDISDIFPTQEPLIRLNIPFTESIHSDSLPEGMDLVIYSGAYNASTAPSLAQAEVSKIPAISYVEALGELSLAQPSVAITGTHGKTTTTAMTGVMLKAVGGQGTTLVGSVVNDFEHLPIDVEGNDFLVAEVCEYRRHFLNFTPKILVVLNVDWDHVDYFKTSEDVDDAFFEMALRLPQNGILIYCTENKGSVRLASRIRAERSDIQLFPYGFGDDAESGFQISEIKMGEGAQLFKVSRIDQTFSLPLIGRELVLNAVAGLAVVKFLGFEEKFQEASQGLKALKGIRRRQERLGEFKGALVMDDYAHHPAEIEVVLKGLREFYPHRRLVVDFMFHTVSRTKGFLKEFAESLSLADILITHPIYTSARESDADAKELLIQFDEEMDKISRETTFEPVYQFGTKEETVTFLKAFLKKGDIFLTMGAGDNFHISHRLVGLEK